MLSLICLLDIQVEMSRRKLQIRVWNSAERPGRYNFRSKDTLFKTSKLGKITKEVSVKRNERVSNDQTHIYRLRRLRWNQQKRRKEQTEGQEENYETVES